MGAPDSDGMIPGLPGVPLDGSAAVALVDRDGRVTCWSDGAQKEFGYAPGEVIGRPVADLFTAPGRSASLRHRDGQPLAAVGRICPLVGGEHEAGFLVAAEPCQEAKAPDGTSAMEWAFQQSPTLLSVFDKDGRLIQLNDAAARTLGRPAAGILGKRMTEFLHGPEYEDAQRRIERVATTGRPDYAEFPLNIPGQPWAHDWAINIFPLRDSAGRVQAVSMVVRDYSEVQGSRERLALLGEARTRIGQSLDVSGAARELADVAVPRFADLIVVDLLEAVFRGDQPAPVLRGPAVLRRAAQRSVYDEEAEPCPATGVPPAVPESSPLTRCLVTGRAELYDPVPPALVRQLTAGLPHAGQAHGDKPHSAIAAPIRARGTVLGVTLLLRDPVARQAFTPDDLAVVEDLMARVAICVDNARRYTRERGVALTLQRSLLPQGPTLHSAVDTAARYLPAGDVVGAGGDWFDVIPLPGARVGLVVGDVVGHGVHASATMGRLRTAVRTLADIDLPPDELLTHLDDIVTHSSRDRNETSDGTDEIPGDIGASCLYAVYDPVSRVCSLSRAGHPAPILVSPDGTARIVDLPAGPPLGLGSLPFEATDLTLPDGSMLALFTDGLVESRRHDLDDRLAQLCGALCRPVASLETVCDSVLETLHLEPQGDDIALLLARTRALDQDQVASWDLTSDPAVVAEARRSACRQLTEWGLEDAAFVTELVVSELVTNAIRYATGPIRLRLIKDQSSLICEVSDGASTTPHMRRARLSDEGGRGLLLVAQLTERWGTRHTSTGKTIWTEQSLTNA
ncbi:SpoIIE family protein phosphatase [Streptomyces sp. NPDC020801]|uniref:SpoIIE family protein phosphatase n=1 Tax=unclassified Streptomyces TaxID=2593676 RepID=UPI00379DE441